MATITITVTVSNPGSGNKYYLDGVLQATYVATPGNTYKFDQSDNSNDGHPLRLSITSNGTHSGGSAYTTGVTTSGVPGNAGAYTQIEVTATTVKLYIIIALNTQEWVVRLMLEVVQQFNTKIEAVSEFKIYQQIQVQPASVKYITIQQ